MFSCILHLLTIYSNIKNIFKSCLQNWEDWEKGESLKMINRFESNWQGEGGEERLKINPSAFIKSIPANKENELYI